MRYWDDEFVMHYGVKESCWLTTNTFGLSGIKSNLYFHYLLSK